MHFVIYEKTNYPPKFYLQIKKCDTGVPHKKRKLRAAKLSIYQNQTSSFSLTGGICIFVKFVALEKKGRLPPLENGTKSEILFWIAWHNHYITCFWKLQYFHFKIIYFVEKISTKSSHIAILSVGLWVIIFEFWAAGMINFAPTNLFDVAARVLPLFSKQQNGIEILCRFAEMFY